MPRFVFLVGLSGSGKSTVGPIVAQRLALPFYDLDAEVERIAGKSIPEIFGQEGERSFRDFETRALKEIVAGQAAVVATGGGAITRSTNVETMAASGWIVYLAVRPEVAAERLLAQQKLAGASAYRPLVGAEDPVSRLKALYAARAQLYMEAAHWTVQTDEVPPWAVASAVVAGVKALESGGLKPVPLGEHMELRSPLGERGQCIVIGKGLLAQLGDALWHQWGLSRAFIVTDAAVARNWLEPVRQALGSAAVDVFVMEPGEASKDLATARSCYDWLAGHKAERRDCIVALGGGVVGDLAGFVASTYVRGMNLVQIPTTLLAMVDAAIGGKTGVNHPKAKNLIGTIYHPVLVVADIDTLSTLSAREFRAGLAEVIKYRAIAQQVSGFTPPVLARLPDLLGSHLLSEVLKDLIAECIRIKLEVVVRDEHESGLRKLLNYGHTIGHAIEAATKYRAVLHGEAVAVGMNGAATISRSLGLVDAAYCDEQAELISRAGLPLAIKADPQRVMAALSMDKKVRSGSIKWVLPTEGGRIRLEVEVPVDVVWRTVLKVTRPSD